MGYIESGDRCRYRDDVPGLDVLMPFVLKFIFRDVGYLNAAVRSFQPFNLRYKFRIVGKHRVTVRVGAHEIEFQLLPVLAYLWGYIFRNPGFSAVCYPPAYVVQAACVSVILAIAVAYGFKVAAYISEQQASVIGGFCNCKNKFHECSAVEFRAAYEQWFLATMFKRSTNIFFANEFMGNGYDALAGGGGYCVICTMQDLFNPYAVLLFVNDTLRHGSNGQ